MHKENTVQAVENNQQRIINIDGAISELAELKTRARNKHHAILDVEAARYEQEMNDIDRFIEFLKQITTSEPVSAAEPTAIEEHKKPENSPEEWQKLS